MSRRRRSRTFSRSSQPSSPTCKKAEPIALNEGAGKPAPSPIEIRYAATDEDVIAIHKFLCVVAGPRLPGPINAQKSAREVWRVASDDVALMAIRDGMLIGTLGLVCPDMWWGDLKFLVNRWFFALPGWGAWRPLLKEARAIAVASELELHIISEERGRVAIFNRSPRRPKRSASAEDDAVI